MKNGFSLLEALIVIAIIAILTATSFPVLNTLSPGWGLSGSTRTILTKLRQAQEESVTSQKQHLIRFDPSATPPTLELIKVDSGETVIDHITLAKNITITIDPTITSNEISFSADGGPSSSGNITVNNGLGSKTINITPAGIIKIL